MGLLLHRFKSRSLRLRRHYVLIVWVLGAPARAAVTAAASHRPGRPRFVPYFPMSTLVLARMVTVVWVAGAVVKAMVTEEEEEEED